MIAAGAVALIAAVAPHAQGPTSQVNPRTHRHDQRVMLIVSGRTVRDIDIQVREDCGGGNVYADTYAIPGPVHVGPSGAFVASAHYPSNSLSLDGRVVSGRGGTVTRVTGVFSSEYTVRGQTCTAHAVSFSARPVRATTYGGTTSQGRRVGVVTVGGALDELTLPVAVRCGSYRFPTVRLDDVPLDRSGGFIIGFLTAPGSPYGGSAEVQGRLRGRTITGTLSQFFYANSAHPSGIPCHPGRVTFQATAPG